MKTTTSKMLDALEQFVKGGYHTGNRFHWEMRVRHLINCAKAEERDSTTHLTETDLMPEGSPVARRIIYIGLKDGYPLSAFGADGPLLQKWLADNQPNATSQIIVLNEE